MIISRVILLRMQDVSDKSCEENIRHVLCSNSFSRKSCHFSDNVDKYGTVRQATVHNMRMMPWRRHPHRKHDLSNGSQDHHPSTNSVQKTICCNSTSNAPDDGRIYPKRCRAKNTSIKLLSCIKFAFHFISWGRCTVKQPSNYRLRHHRHHCSRRRVVSEH